MIWTYFGQFKEKAMFWKEANGYRDVPMSSKIGLTLFLVVAGIGYLFGLANIYVSYSGIDHRPGLSVQDIRIAFYGARQKTALETAISGGMKQYFKGDEKAYQATLNWVHAGARQAEFTKSIKPVFDKYCLMCHSKAAQAGGVVVATYTDLKPQLQQDTGKSVARLITLSHVHVLGTLSVIFILALIFLRTKFSETLKVIMMIISFGAIVLDVGSWWLTKASGAMAPLVIVGGALLGVSFALLIIFSLYDIWLRKSQS